MFPEGIDVAYIADLNHAVIKAIEQNVNILIVNQSLDISIAIKYSDKMNFILWCHTFLSHKEYNLYNAQPNILKLLHVGREQMDLYRDHPAFKKSDYIYNGVSMDSIDRYIKNFLPYKSRANNVVHISNMSEAKGFHFLAKVWSTVLRSIPDAQLYVIGSGKLYNRNAVLGKYGIAEYDYEPKFMKYLTDTDGKILQSVHFEGIMGVVRMTYC